MVQRLTYRRRLSYNTTSNKRKIVKTPGGRLVYHYKKKAGTVPKASIGGGYKQKLHGIAPSRPLQRSRMSKRLKTVNRPYGGVETGSQVRDRIIRAFLIEEQKIVAKVMKAQSSKQQKVVAKK